MNQAPTAFFFGPEQGFAGARYALLHAPVDQPVRGALLYLHPFAEEMNRSRRMAALQARELAREGWFVLQLDLKGCGDSEGDFGDACWEDWLQDATAAYAWLTQQTNCKPWLWGLRVGALLAVETARRLPAPPDLLLWHPTTDGAAAWRQFSRLARPGEAKARRQTDERNDPLHVAGYALASSLVEGLNSSSLLPALTAPGPSPAANQPLLFWLDVSPDGEPLPAHQRCAAAWQAAGWSVAQQTLKGSGFWATAEIETSPALLAATSACLRQIALSVAAAASTAPRLPSASTNRPSGIETAVSLLCQGEWLQGIVSAPSADRPWSGLDLLMVVGGPQVRTGAHRMFTVLARYLSEQGHRCLRLDLRGMGDSTGDPCPFDARDAELSAALQAFGQATDHAGAPVLWGLCDGASAALLYTLNPQAPPIRGLCLANAWARTEAGLAQTRAQHYYRDRMRDTEFWHKLLTGGVGLEALRDWWQNRQTASAPDAEPDFVRRMQRALIEFQGPGLLLQASRDETAHEFAAFFRRLNLGASPQLGTPPASSPSTSWRWAELSEADHTFSQPGGMIELAERTAEWLDGLKGRRRPAAR